eukprot:8010383-Pyramimonas_sp.AAC.1
MRVHVCVCVRDANGGGRTGGRADGRNETDGRTDTDGRTHGQTEDGARRLILRPRPRRAAS